MFRWNFILRKLFNLPLTHLFSNRHLSRLRRERQKVRRSRRCVQPVLEELTPRIVPSASGGESQTAALPMVAAMEQQAIQLTEAAQNEIIGIVRMVAQQIAQDEVSLQQQWNNLFSDFFSPQNPYPSYSTPSAVNGSGSGAATTPHENAPTEGTIKPMVGGGGVQPNAGGGGGGTSGTATVQGQVWLDNNGDGLEDNHEEGFAGITVNLLGPSPMTTTTAGNGDYYFNVDLGNGYYQIQVDIPQDDQATVQGPPSQIDSSGYSPAFALTPGDTVVIPAGIRSMNVTTTLDDASTPLQNQVVALCVA